MKASIEFNVSKDTLVEFLESKGFDASEMQRDFKLTEDMYRVAQSEFQLDKAAKAKAQQVELVKTGGNNEPKKKKDEEDLSIKKKETVKAKDTKTEEVKPETEVKPEDKQKNVETESVTETLEPTKIVAPEIESLKVVDKIDLSSIDSSTRPRKNAKKGIEVEKEDKSSKKEEPEEVNPPKNKKTTVSEKDKKEEATTPETSAKEVEHIKEQTPVIENIQARKLTGPKIMGKIELPAENDTRPKKESDEKRKRKRIPMEKKGGSQQQGGNGQMQQGIQNRRPGGSTTGTGASNRGGSATGRFARGTSVTGRREDKVIDAKEIQDKLRETQAKLAGSGGRGKSLKAKYRKAKRDEQAELSGTSTEDSHKLQVTEFISVSELANLMDVSFADVISKCMSLGIMVSINQRLEADVIELVASEFNFEVEFIGVEDAAEMEVNSMEDNVEDQLPRAPIVTIMGHVDHGKTSLLDHIRNTNVIAGEAGGITQHIGAYEVSLKEGRRITFLDTPGHEAFTAMRARGAKVTDIAVIVVAADDAVMPQTREAISHAQAAGVPMIFAINKIDKDGANPEKIKEQLASMNILVESWGGKYQSQEISARKGLNIDLLLEKILLETDILELKANPDKQASGTIIEATLDKGRGYVATILVQNGTLNVGDMIVSGQYFGKIKAMYDERNQRKDTAPPSTPVLILGLNGAPQAGETFKVFENESEAREVAYKRGQILREQGMRAKKHITLDEIGRRLALGSFKELNVIIKGDVDGSVEALSDSLQKLSTEEIVIKVIHKAVGAITESDVTLANASDAIIIGFNVRPSMQAAKLAEQEAIQIKLYSIIYNAIEEIKSAMEGMLEPVVEEKILANVEIREVYKFDKASVAGCFVLDGKMARNNRIRLVRDGIVIFTGELGSLKRFKDDAKEVTSSMECGLTIRNYNDIKVGDIVEAFEEVEVKRTL